MENSCRIETAGLRITSWLALLPDPASNLLSSCELVPGYGRGMSDSETGEDVADDDKAPRKDPNIGIFPSHQGPTYIIMPNKQDKDRQTAGCTT